jgi:dTDP-4-amino-4,6-dideoxygalactose transaminase
VTRFVPFNRAYTTGDELRYIGEAIEATALSGNGPFCARCGEWLAHHAAVGRALMTHSCTGALEMAVLLAGVGPGDEVIMPSFTFVSTANAVVARGGIPVFVDIRPDTLNLDEMKVEAALTPRTRALIAVHYAGVGCEMDALIAIAREHRLAVIEDAAQGISASYRGLPLGGIGDLGTLSFHETKNVMCGEGGALLIGRDEWIDRAEIVHEKGTDRRRFDRGQVDKYTWQDFGSSFAMSDLSAAFLWAQLAHAEAITQRRLEIWETYHAQLQRLGDEGHLRRPIVPDHCVHNGHIYYVLLRRETDRGAVLTALNSAGVSAVFHYVPLHLSPAGQRYGRPGGGLDVTEDLSERLVRLPLWAAMEEADIEHVLDALGHVLSRSHSTARR